MMSTAKTRAQDAARAARPLVSDCGACDQISVNAAANGVAAGILIWDEAGECYRIADAYSWSDVDALSDAPPALKFFVTASIRGVPVMCDTIEAKSISAAIEIWRNEFADAPGKLRAQLPNLNELNRGFAEDLLKGMDQHRADAAVYGVEFKARPSRAKVSA